MMTPRVPALPHRVVGIAVALSTLALVLLVLEGGLRLVEALQSRDASEAPSRYRPCTPCARVFELNPDHREYSSLGLRDREFAVPAPPGVTRILMLGDSVTYGVRVHVDSTFSRHLEHELRARGDAVEVINAGVTGYTPWNELHFYRERLRSLDPDVVVVVLCLNDVADPQLHWAAQGKAAIVAPAGSIPNAAYHDTRILDELRLQRLRRHPVRVVRAAARRWLDGRRARRLESEGFREVDGRRWPVYLTAEDPLPIDVLLDAESAEWRWLRGVLDQLADEVHADGARLVIALAPLAYQADPAYPFHPQENVARYCEERGVPFVDLLPALRGDPAAGTYWLDGPEGRDVWHFGPRGHAVVAAELARALQDIL